MTWKLKIRSFISAMLYYSGGTGVLLKNKKMMGGIIAAYHRVLNIVDESLIPVQAGMYVTVDDFRSQIFFEILRFSRF